MGLTDEVDPGDGVGHDVADDASNVAAVVANDEGEYVGWYLARKSNTEPVLVMRMEATDEEELQAMRTVVENRVANIIDISKLLNA